MQVKLAIQTKDGKTIVKQTYISLGCKLKTLIVIFKVFDYYHTTPISSISFINQSVSLRATMFFL